MPRNPHASTNDLLAAVDTMLAALPKEGTNPFGISVAQITSLDDEPLKSALTHLGTLRANLASAVQAKDLLKGALSKTYSKLSAVAYASSASDVQLATIGLKPRRTTSPRPKLPAQPTGLVATPFADGTAKIAWDRGSNARPTSFLVETSDDGLVWTYRTMTTRVSLSLNGCPPAQPIWFRVTATNSMGDSAPSASASIYAPSAAARNLTKDDFKVAA